MATKTSWFWPKIAQPLIANLTCASEYNWDPENWRRSVLGDFAGLEKTNPTFRLIATMTEISRPSKVFWDLDTSAEEMLAQGEEMFSWIPNAYIKYPCTHQGLKAAEMSVRQRIRVNMTLCFSQEQAAAVYAATKESRGDGHVHVLAASIRHLDHLLASFALDVELVPAKVLEKWTTSNFPLPALACLMHEGGRSHVIGMNGGLKEGWQEPILDWSRC